MSTWTISLDDEGNAASVERGHHPGERAILLVEAPAAAGDATPVIARSEIIDILCAAQGEAFREWYEGRPGDPYGPEAMDRAMAAAEPIAERLRGAVDALVRIAESQPPVGIVRARQLAREALRAMGVDPATYGGR